MKLATYNPVVNKSSINGVQVRAYDDGSAAYMRQSAAQTETAGRIAASIGQMQGQTLKGIANTIQNVGEQIDAVNVQAASNEYTKRLNDVLYNQDNGLMNTQMQGADGITQKFTEAEKQIRQEVGKKYSFFSIKGSNVFNRMTDNSAAQRYEMVRRHQTQQFQAYQNQTYDNALGLNVQTAADNYAMPEIVEQNIAEAIATTRMRYAGQGEEVLKAQERKAIGAIAQQVINRAYANGNDDMAGTYIEKFGKYMNPAELTQYSKAVHQRVVANITRNTSESLVDKYGNNIGAIYDAIYNRGEGGSGYDGNAAVAWMKEQVKNGVGWGRNTCTKGVNAALMVGGGIPGNTWAPFNWADAKKAGIAFTDRSQLRTGDIVYWWKPGKDKDASDCSHVGIYDAETGKVYQSGTSGFAPMDLDYYSVTGFARPQGKGMTAEQKDALFKSCQHLITQKKAVQNAYQDEMYKSLDSKLMGLSTSGNVDIATYNSMVDMTVGADPEARRRGYQLANYWWRHTANAGENGTVGRNGSGGNKRGFALETERGLTETLMYNNFDSEAEWASVVVRQNPTPEQYNRMMKLYQQKKQGKGVFEPDWDGLKETFKAQNREMDTALFNATWKQAQSYAMGEIIKYWNDHKRQPTNADVMGFINESLSTVDLGTVTKPGWFIDSDIPFAPTKGQLRSAGIEWTEKLPSGQLKVHYSNGVEEITTSEGLKTIMMPFMIDSK